MKRTLSLIALLIVAKVMIAQETVTIKGSIANLDGHKIAINYRNETKNVRDTIETVNGEFEVTLNVPTLQEISLNPYMFHANEVYDVEKKVYYMSPRLKVLVAPGDVVNIKGDAMTLWQAQVTGLKYQDDYDQLQAYWTPYYTTDNELMIKQIESKNEGNTKAMDEIFEERKARTNQFREFFREFAARETNNMYALCGLSQYYSIFDLDNYEAIFNSYSPEMKGSSFGKRVEQYIKKVRASERGQSMMDFKGSTLEGNRFDSKQLRGKYVLLDFWGSWCGSCRKSHPHLIELYNKYNDKGFEILGIAYEMAKQTDKKRQDAIKAVEKDGLIWTQILNEDIDDFDAIKAYNVSSFPTKMLIDKDGVIIWKGTGVESKELDELLIKIFN